MVGRDAPPLNLGFFGPAFIYNHFLDLHRGNKDHVLTRCSKAFKGWSNMFWLSPCKVETQKWTFATTTTTIAAVWGPRSASLGWELGKTCGRESVEALKELLHVFQLKYLNCSLLLVSIHPWAEFVRLKILWNYDCFCATEWRIVQSVSMEKSFLAAFSRPLCTSMWCKTHWLPSKDPHSSTHQVVSSGLVGLNHSLHLKLSAKSYWSQQPWDVSSSC